MTMTAFCEWVQAALQVHVDLPPRSPHVDQADLHHSEVEYFPQPGKVLPETIGRNDYEV
jgi:hypothetical protein